MVLATFNTSDGSICLWASFVLQLIYEAVNFHLYCLCFLSGSVSIFAGIDI